MGPSEYVRILRSRWWAIVVLVVVGAGLAWITTPPRRTPTAETARFRATAVLVKAPSTNGAPTSDANLALASSLVASSVLVDEAARDLGRPVSDLTVDLAVAVNDKAGTLEISSVDADPAQATREADTLAAHLVTFLAERRQQQLDPQIAATSARIETFESRLTELNAQILIPGSPEADLQRAERDSVVRQLSASFDRLQQLTTQAADGGGQLVALAPAAAVPESVDAGFSAPDSPAARGAIGFVVGLLAAIALVLAFERLDPKVRSTAQAEEAFGLPVIAEIPRPRRWRSRRRGGIATYSEPHSVTAESYRSLRTALTYLPRQNDDRVRGDDRFANGHVVLVTSAEPAEGKTTVVANLAAAFAEKDAGVVVVSGDARHPSVETLLLGRRAAGAKLATDKQSESVLTMIPGVNLVLSCDPITNPADIVSYERAVVRRARARSQTVVIDTPPALVANDATELMHVADSVVLVARCGSTSMASARRTADLISRLDVAVVGVVLVGTPAAAVADANYYYRNRPAPRPTLASWHRREVVPTEGADAPAPPRAEVSSAAAVPPIDDGGIWRPKSVIDLSSAHSALEDEPETTDERFDHPERLPLFRGPDRPGNGAPK